MLYRLTTAVQNRAAAIVGGAVLCGRKMGRVVYESYLDGQIKIFKEATFMAYAIMRFNKMKGGPANVK